MRILCPVVECPVVLANGVFAPWLVKLNYGGRMWMWSCPGGGSVCSCTCHAHTLHVFPLTHHNRPVLHVHCTPLLFPLGAGRTRLGNFSNIFLPSYTHFSLDFPFAGKYVAPAFGGFN